MLYKIKKYNISVDFNFPGKYTGNDLIYDIELKKMFLFNYVTKEENISASCLKVQENFDLLKYVEANLKNFAKIRGKILFTKKNECNFFVLVELPYDKAIQIYFMKKLRLYCFSATIPLNAKISGFNMCTYDTTKRMLYIISSIKELNKNIDF